MLEITTEFSLLGLGHEPLEPFRVAESLAQAPAGAPAERAGREVALFATQEVGPEPRTSPTSTRKLPRDLSEKEGS